ncbi:hypothetical protein Aab01nite_05310 [Paractinoplanes abujensis]|uniref:Uncharacterized protein n=1 Tax=Paractinoplanes abujensis TaxID=882441 RepID=A0A7W7CQW2_9ACTN|nr:hypothetical protein [Actinoplanes abujensis]MBB4691640.1 hypothetical protein [Actinoplanes abujensis]GID16941.1 hypothetical protein Aab01nite_05310 [Actinoplanes abujensis]
MPVVVDKFLTVTEHDNDKDTGIEVRNGDWIDISASGRIWAGVWFTSENGPNGWTGWAAGEDKPLPGAPPFSLIGKMADGEYFYIGAGLRRTYQNATLGPGATRLYLTVNDDKHGNGTGAFTVRIQVWR